MEKYSREVEVMINRGRFIEALESGNYKRGRNFLKQVDMGGYVCHCPMGVACEIYHRDNQNQSKWQSDGDYFVFHIDGETISRYNAPLSVRKFLGMSREQVKSVVVAGDSGASISHIVGMIRTMEIADED